MKHVIFVLSLMCFSVFVPQSAKSQWASDPGANNAICASAHQQTFPVSVSDGAGGAIIAWKDFRSNNTTDIYAQRISKAGNILWTVNGDTVGDGYVNTNNGTVSIVSDGSGGAIIVWPSYKSGIGIILGQRIDSSGVLRWKKGGGESIESWNPTKCSYHSK